MAIGPANNSSSITVRDGEPLIGIFIDDKNLEMVCYFTTAEAADDMVSAEATKDALALAGAWRDLDWDTLSGELDRIRHESPPSPPISL